MGGGEYNAARGLISRDIADFERLLLNELLILIR